MVPPGVSFGALFDSLTLLQRADLHLCAPEALSKFCLIRDRIFETAPCCLGQLRHMLALHLP